MSKRRNNDQTTGEKPWLDPRYEGPIPMGVWKVHRIADIFPMMQGQRFTDFASDISEHGLREPVVFWLDAERRRLVLVDGRNRAKALKENGQCQITASEWVFAWFDSEEDVSRYIFSLNIQRRHLSDAERAKVSLEMLEHFKALARKRQAHGLTAPGQTLRADRPEALTSKRAREEVAELADISPKMVARTDRVRRNAIPEIYQTLGSECGLAATPAEQLSKLHKEEQREAWERGVEFATRYANTMRHHKGTRVLWPGRLVELNTGMAERGQKALSTREEVWITVTVLTADPDGYVLLELPGGERTGEDLSEGRVRLLGGGAPQAPPWPDEARPQVPEEPEGDESPPELHEDADEQEDDQEEEECWDEEGDFDPTTFHPSKGDWVTFIEDLDEIPAGATGQVIMLSFRGVGGAIEPPTGAGWKSVFVTAPILRPATKAETAAAMRLDGPAKRSPGASEDGDAPEAEDIQALDEMLQDATVDARERDVVYAELLQLSVRVTEAIGAIERRRPSAKGMIRWLRRTEIEIRTRAEEVRAGAAAR